MNEVMAFFQPNKSWCCKNARFMLIDEDCFGTGANRGLGLELVSQISQLSDPQFMVFAACRNPESAHVLQSLAHNNTNCQVIQIDVSNQQSIIDASVEVTAKLHQFGLSGLDLLINNAGIYSALGSAADSEEKLPLLDMDDGVKVFRVEDEKPLNNHEYFVRIWIYCTERWKLPLFLQCEQGSFEHAHSFISS
jgi:NAD(P)-dependent dehydrogenase (short-subunit alcohol dehydrogenase family)